MDILYARKEHSKFIVNAQIEMAMETENLQLDLATVTRGVNAVFENESLGQYIVVTSDEIPIASTLVIPEWSDWRAKKVWWIHSVYVVPDFRGQGVFRKIYDFLKVKINSNDEVAGLRLYVDKSNINAQKVYQKIGMSNEHYELYEWLKN